MTYLLRVLSGGFIIFPEPFTTVLGIFLLYLSFRIVARLRVGVSPYCGCDYHRFGVCLHSVNFIGRKPWERRYYA